MSIVVYNSCMTRLAIDTQAIVSNFANGMSVKQIALQMGVSRATIVRRMMEAGIRPRSQSESMYLRWQTADAASKKAHADRVGKMFRGKTRPRTTLVRRAQSNERPARMNVSERLMASMLAESGIECIPQKQIDIYNVDLAHVASKTAIELFGGTWHAVGRHAERHARRIETLNKNGWHVLCVWNTSGIDGNGITAIAEYCYSKSRSKCKHIYGNGTPCHITISPSVPPARHIDNWDDLAAH